MWSPTTGAIVVVDVGGIVVVVVGGIVVVVVGAMVVVVEVVDAVVGITAGADVASCHWESTYEAAPPPISAVTTRRTMPTLRLERPP
jgi:hypothetical protein